MPPAGVAYCPRLAAPDAAAASDFERAHRFSHNNRVCPPSSSVDSVPVDTGKGPPLFQPFYQPPRARLISPSSSPCCWSVFLAAIFLLLLLHRDPPLHRRNDTRARAGASPQQLQPCWRSADSWRGPRGPRGPVLASRR